MRDGDIVTLSRLGRALWSDRERYVRISGETVSAMTLLPITEEKRAERAAASLLKRALKEGLAQTNRINLSSIAHPFFRLSPEKRFALAAVHSGGWSYARVSRVFAEAGNPEESVAKLAWSARVELALAAGATYPAGASATKASCPEYDSESPWTQKFLDQEFANKNEQLFFQNHLMACDGCANALSRCRDMYYTVEKLLTGVLGSEQEADLFAKDLKQMIRAAPFVGGGSDPSISHAFRIFLRRKDVQYALGLLLALVIWKAMLPVLMDWFVQ